MKLNYVSSSPTDLPTEDNAIYERVIKRRGLGGFLPLDLTLLHSPKLADGMLTNRAAFVGQIPILRADHSALLLGWNSLLGAVRTQGCLSDDLREICICRPALINKAWFEWTHHAPLLEAAEGFTPEKLAVIGQLNPAGQGPLSDRQWAVLRYSDAMTKDVLIPDDIFKDLQRAGFNEKEIVEITLTCATYNMVSRFLVALDVGEANSSPPNLGSNLETGEVA
ncbi:hypothetical protein VE02_08169 [Pseudogymnoascus sp. 03VT05]|nr:hypothetical protein VE02_08169 [Pseudogymnoascus sp. 03VT05]